MKSRTSISILFYIAAVYEGILGLGFLLKPTGLYHYFQIPLPHHLGYVRFPAAMLVIFAIMFVCVAADPIRNRNLIPFGMLLKVSYATIIFWYWFTQGLSAFWKPLAVTDLIFLVFFMMAYIRIPKLAKTLKTVPGCSTSIIV